MGPSPTPSAFRLPWLVVLAAWLMAAQFALVQHGIEHSFQKHEGACVLCLALPGSHALPAPPQTLSLSPAVAEPPASAFPAAPAFASPLPFHSRAPPARQSC